MSFKIAVLEDDAEFRDEILLPELAGMGFLVEGFGTSGVLDLRMREEKFDVLVLDIGLSGEHGLDIARRLRAQSAMGIVTLTGRAIRDEQIFGLRESVDAWLKKPVDIEVLAATLISVARRLRTGAPASHPPSIAKTWRIGANGWQLVAPDGRELALSLPERLLLGRLFDSPGEPVAREDLIACIAPEPTDFDPHRLEMLVHRLRRRVLIELDSALPVRAIRGFGYVALRVDEPHDSSR
jgi:DNA-binding response OmpR family regulator